MEVVQDALGHGSRFVVVHGPGGIMWQWAGREREIQVVLLVVALVTEEIEDRSPVTEARSEQPGDQVGGANPSSWREAPALFRARPSPLACILHARLSLSKPQNFASRRERKGPRPAPHKQSSTGRAEEYVVT